MVQVVYAEKASTCTDINKEKVNESSSLLRTIVRCDILFSINIKTITDDSNSHIAEMTLKGTIMGLTELIRDISDYAPILKPQVLSCVEEVKDFEEKCEAELKKHL